jgi:hypothetical protein
LIYAFFYSQFCRSYAACWEVSSGLIFGADVIKKAFDKRLGTNWNSLVEGTIAFLENDPKKGPKRIAVARDKIARKEGDHPYVQALDNLIKCFGKPYKDIDVCLASSTQTDDSNPVSNAIK